MTNNAAPVFSNQYGHIYRVLAPGVYPTVSSTCLEFQDQDHQMMITCFSLTLISKQKENVLVDAPIVAAPLTDIQTVNFLRNGSA